MKVIHALMLKDAIGRYGHEHLGFFWLIGEPLMLTFGVMALWSLTGATHGSEIGVVPFALTGYTFITQWRHIVSKSINAMSKNAVLGYHRQVKHIDVMTARAGLEVIGIFSAFIVAYVPLTLLGYCPVIRDPLLLVVGFFLSGWFSFGFGLILAGLSEMSEALHFFIGPLMYLSIPLTGVFFMIDWLPASAQKVLSWSPLINCIEMYRSGLFPSDVVAHFSISYIIVCCLLATCIGIAICHFAEKQIEQ